MNGRFGLFIGALSNVFKSDAAVLVYQVPGRPESLLVSSPRPVVVVDGDGIFYTQLIGRGDDVLQFFFVSEFGIVDADHGERFATVLLMPFPDPGNHSLAVNSAEGPKFDQNYLAL